MGKNTAVARSFAEKIGTGEAWFGAGAREPKGVLVLAHGLNLKPERMDELATGFARAGYEVFRPAFTGHFGGNETFLQVKAEHWEADARRIHALASVRAKDLGKPVFLGAYSFSALVFQVLSAELPFDRRLYFAPALRSHFWYSTVMFFAHLFPGRTFTSIVTPEYRAQPVSGTRTLIALHDFMKRFVRGEGAGDKAPALIWVDPKDELVSFSRISELARERENWEVRRLTNKDSPMRKKYHHLIINADSLGGREWERMVRESAEFLGAR